MEVEPIGGNYERTALLDLDLRHTGVSLLTRNGQTYMFRHYNERTTSPINWKTTYDGLAHTFAPDTDQRRDGLAAEISS